MYLSILQPVLTLQAQFQDISLSLSLFNKMTKLCWHSAFPSSFPLKTERSFVFQLTSSHLATELHSAAHLQLVHGPLHEEEKDNPHYVTSKNTVSCSSAAGRRGKSCPKGSIRAGFGDDRR